MGKEPPDEQLLCHVHDCVAEGEGRWFYDQYCYTGQSHLVDAVMDYVPFT